LIITDGRCGSTCSHFTKHLSEEHFAKFIGKGITWAKQDTVEFDIGSLGSGNEVDSYKIQELAERNMKEKQDQKQFQKNLGIHKQW